MDNFVSCKDGRFYLNHKQFRFIGANVYELANVGSDVAEKIIYDSFSCGFRALRFWLFENDHVSVQVKKLHSICDYVKPYGIKLIVSLADKWGYLQNYKIDENWYEYGYKSGFLSYTKSIVSEFRDRDEIMIWEIINEPETDSFKTFYDFVSDVGDTIKSIDDKHIISLGTVGGIGDKFGGYLSVLRKKYFRKIYNLPYIDAISIHDYSYDSSVAERLDTYFRFTGNEKAAVVFRKINNIIGSIFHRIDSFFLEYGKLIHLPFTLRWLWNCFNNRDIKFSKTIGKPLYIGETGLKSYPARDRLKIMEFDMQRKFSAGVSGYVLWSFESQGCSKDGHGYGFSPSDELTQLIKKWNLKLQEP